MKKITVCIILLVLNACTPKKSAPSIYIIPKGYIGEVILVFNYPIGKEKVYKHKKRVYQIPKSGLLTTKFSATYGYIYDTYYRVGENDTLEILPSYKVTDPEQLCIYNNVTSTTDIKGITYEVSAFKVCKKKDIYKYAEFSFDELHKLQEQQNY